MHLFCIVFVFVQNDQQKILYPIKWNACEKRKVLSIFGGHTMRFDKCFSLHMTDWIMVNAEALAAAFDIRTFECYCERPEHSCSFSFSSSFSFIYHLTDRIAWANHTQSTNDFPVKSHTHTTLAQIRQTYWRQLWLLCVRIRIFVAPTPTTTWYPNSVSKKVKRTQFGSSQFLVWFFSLKR